jgi:hypothetical protein
VTGNRKSGEAFLEFSIARKKKQKCPKTAEEQIAKRETYSLPHDLQHQSLLEEPC